MFDDIRGHGRQKACQKQSTENQVSHALTVSRSGRNGKAEACAAEFLAEQIAKGSVDPDRVRNLVGRRAHPDFLISLAKRLPARTRRSIFARFDDPEGNGSAPGRRDSGNPHRQRGQDDPKPVNALLKTLEEPPANNIFVLVTSRTTPDHSDGAEQVREDSLRRSDGRGAGSGSDGSRTAGYSRCADAGRSDQA